MPAGIGVGALLGLVREARSLEQHPAAIVVSGVGATELARALTEGGDPGAVRVGGDATGAALALLVLAAPPAAAERELMRRATRGGVPVVAVRTRGFSGAVPYALPGDVIDAAGEDAAIASVVETIASALRDADAVSLARQLPLLREPVQRRLIDRTATLNALIGAAPWTRSAHLPLMSLAQGRMLLGLAAARGAVLAGDPQRLAAAAGPPLAASVVAGVGLRGLYRRLPYRGPVAAALVAYLGTRAVGEAGRRVLRPG